MNFKNAIFLSLIVFVTAGCFSTTRGPSINSSSINSIRKGVSTEETIKSVYGKPMDINRLPDGTTVYLYEAVKTKQSIFGKITNDISRLKVTFKNNVVADYTFDELTHYGAYYRTGEEMAAAQEAARQQAIQNSLNNNAYNNAVNTSSGYNNSTYSPYGAGGSYKPANYGTNNYGSYGY